MPAPHDTHVRVSHHFAMVPEGLLYDPAISSHAVRVYGVLHRHGTDPENCYPTHARIAAFIGASQRSVPGWLRELEAAGWIERHQRTKADGSPDSNGYTVHAVPLERAGERTHRAGQRAPLPAGQRAPSTPHSAPNESQENESQENETTNGPAPSSAQLALVSTEQLRASQQLPSPGGHDLAFDRFWQVYPRKVGKLDARKAWTSALRHAPDHVIVAGAERYAADPNRSDEYTAHPATWLRRGSWADQPLPERAPQRGQGKTRGQAAIDGYLQQRGSAPPRGVLHRPEPPTPKGLPR